MQRLGFTYKKPKLVPRVADEATQQAHIARYQALLGQMGANEAVVFADAVHPEHQAKPADGWFWDGSRPALTATSGRQRINVHAAINLETGCLSYIEEQTLLAKTTRALLERIETAHTDKAIIHVFLDNARYHHAQVLQAWLNAPDRPLLAALLPSSEPD